MPPSYFHGISYHCTVVQRSQFYPSSANKPFSTKGQILTQGQQYHYSQKFYSHTAESHICTTEIRKCMGNEVQGFEISVLTASTYDDCSLLRHKTVWFGQWLPTHQKILLSPSLQTFTQQCNSTSQMTSLI